METKTIETLIGKQREWCFKDFLQIDNYQEDRAKFYKNVLGAVFSVIVISVAVFSGLVAWSYAPIKDIATLKAEMRILNQNVNKLLKLNGHQSRGGENNMDMNSHCPKCGYSVSLKINKVKRQCTKCAVIFTAGQTEEAKRNGAYIDRQIAINKNPALDAR